MKFSVVIPTFNSSEYIHATLESLVSQSYKDFEVIISDGRSTDGTLDIVESFKGKLDIVVRSSRDKGMYDALNQGFELANGDIYCYLNSDDLYAFDALHLACEYFSKYNETEFLFGNMYMFGHDFKQKIIYPPLFKPFFISVDYSMFGQPSTFWKPELYKRVGGFDSSLKMAGDYDFFCKCLSSNIKRLSTCFSYFRVHPSSLTSNNIALSRREMSEIVERHFGIKNRSFFLRLVSDVYFKLFNISNSLRKVKLLFKRKI
ncbi:glycosyltransferase family 2 protein [Vibrio ostreicida]|uniref:glycosyltransferase family 2 protein n=1 Tax=Vibrio ostreicida TaxID=526588 RepID=UPI0009713199|nr:glycosyltransferase family 2 protein [Vibrio ostreicida]